MTAIAALVRENPGLLAMLVLPAIGIIVFGSLTIVLSRSGASLRPIVFVGGMVTLVWLPQFAYHLGVATGAVPRRNLTRRLLGTAQTRTQAVARTESFAEFFTRFRAALASGRAADVAALAHTPFLYEGRQLDTAGFTRIVPTLFSAAVKRCFATAKPIPEDDRQVVFCKPYAFYFGREDAGRGGIRCSSLRRTEKMCVDSTGLTSTVTALSEPRTLPAAASRRRWPPPTRRDHRPTSHR